MLIRNANADDLNLALNAVNRQFNDNIRFKRFDHAGYTRQGTPKYNVTLTVNDSHAQGARIAPYSPYHNTQRAIAAACWHAHRAFLDALPPQAEVITAMGQETYTTGTKIHTRQHVWHPGDSHQDRTIGSQAYPCQASEACRCNE